MADARYLIDIILNARDNTSAAVQRAMASLGALEAQMKRNEAQAQTLGEQYERAFKKQDEQNRSLTASEKALTAAREKLGAASTKTLEAQQALEKASRTYAQTLQKEGAEAAATVLAHSKMVDVQKKLIDLIKAENENREKNQKIKAAERAQEIKDAAFRAEMASIRVKLAEDVAKAELDAEKKLRDSKTALAIQQANELEALDKRVAASREALAKQHAEEMLAAEKLSLESRTALALQQAAELEALDKRSADSRAALAKQRAEEEIANEKLSQESRAALAVQRAAEEEALEKRIADSRAALAKQHAEEDLALEKRSMESRTALLLQRAQEEAELEKRAKESRTSLAIQRAAEEEALEKRIAASRAALAIQRAQEEEELQKRMNASSASLTRQRYEEEEAARERAVRSAVSLAEQQAKAEEEAAKQTTQAFKAQVLERAKAERDYQNLVRTTRAARDNRDRAEQEGAPDAVVANMDADIGKLEAKLAFAAMLLEMFDGKTYDVELDIDTDRFVANMGRARSSANETQSSFKALSGVLGNMLNGFESGSNRIASFDNMIRGLFTLGITVFLQQLIQVAGAAVGMLMALASSAVQAGAALGGALAAGAAQAIPVLGVLGTAISRLTKIFEAVKQANNEQEQASYKGAAADNQQANAADAVADAQRRQQEAAERLMEARAEALTQLEDLILAEREAELAARGAVLSQEEAQRALRSAVSSGRSSDIRRAQLRVDETGLGVDRATMRLDRARNDAAEARAGGIDSMPNVESAKKQLEDANRALVRAKRSADASGASISAAQGKLNYLLAGMTASEVKLYEALRNLQERFQGFARNVSEPLIQEFTRMTGRVSRILEMPSMISSAKKLSGQMAVAMGDMFGFLSSDKVLSQFRRIADQAGENLKPLTGIAKNLAGTFLNIAEAAGPAFRDMLDWILEITNKVDDFIKKGKDTGQLTEFFRDGVDHLKSWANLMWQVIRLFAAISGAGGAETGKKAVDDMADSIDKAADRINTAGSKARKFWEDFFETSREMWDALKPIFSALAEEFRKTFNEGGVNSVKGFSSLMAEVLIPALGDFIRTIGSAVASVGNFVEENKGLAKVISGIIAGFLALSIVGKVVSLFTPLGTAISSIAKFLSRGADEGAKFAKAMERLGSGFSKLGKFLISPFTLAIGGLVLFLDYFGKLDEVGRGFIDMFRRIGRQVKQPLEGLIDAVRNLFKTLNGVKESGFGEFLGEVADFISDVLVIAFETLADIIGPLFSNLIEIVEAVVEAFDALLRLDFGDFLLAIGKIGKAILEGIFGSLRGLSRGILRILWRALEFVVTEVVPAALKLGAKLVSLIIQGFVALPVLILGIFVKLFENRGKIMNFLESLPSKLGKIGEKIAEAIGEGIGKLPGIIGRLLGKGGELAKTLVNGIIELLNEAIPNKLGVIDLPNNPIKKFASGGPVDGVGNEDSVHALLMPGEHVLTKKEVQNAGGHGVIFALRRLLGGGGQARGSAYAPGGEVRNRPGTSASSQTHVNVDADTDGFAHRWRLMWAEVVASTRRNTNLVQTQIRQMRVGIETTMLRLSREFHERWNRMSSHATKKAEDMWKGVRRNVMNLQTTVYRGMSYIGTATNSALKSFDADPVKLDIERPSGGAESRAVGGFVGQPGERGKDKILTVLGRGEAVLNHWQQRAINALLPGQTTLASIMGKTVGYHAGGKEQPGYARGRIVPIPGQPGESIAARIRGQVVTMMRRYKMAVTDGFATSGHAPNSDHYRGLAADFVPGQGGNWDKVDAAAAYARQRLNSVFRWIGYDGVAGHGRGHHLHLSWLADPKGIGSAALEQIKRLSVKGTGPLKELAQKMLNKVRNAANNLLSADMEDGEMTEHPTGDNIMSRSQVMSVIGQAMNLAGVPTLLQDRWRAMAYARARQESGFNPNAQNNWDINAKNGVPSKGLFQTIAPTFAAHNLPGMNNILNPLHNAVAAFRYMFANYGGGKSWETALSRMLGRAGVGYATGGIIPGDQEGAPQPILAHAGEWILNKLQQSKLAKALGMGVGQLRDFMGFTGGPTSFAGGGDVEGGQGYQFFSGRSMVEQERHEARMAALKGKNNADEREAEQKRHNERMAAIKKEEKAERERFEKMRPEQQRMANIRRGSYEAGMTDPRDVAGVDREIGRARRAIRNLGRPRGTGNVLGKLISNIEAIVGEGGLLEQMDAAIERRSARLRVNLSLAQAGLRRVTRNGRSILVNRERLTDPARIAEREAENLQSEGRGLRNLRGDSSRELRRVNTQISRLRRGGISEQERAQFQQLVAQRNSLNDRLTELDGEIAQNRIDLYEKQKEAFEKSTDASMKKLSAGDKWMDYVKKVADTLGLGPETQNKILGEEIKTLEGKRAYLMQRANDAKKAGHLDLYEKYIGEALDAGAEIIAKGAEQTRNVVEGINKRAEGRTRAIGRTRRIAEAFGRSGDMIGLHDQEMSSLQTQRDELMGALGHAQNQGNAGLAAEIWEQIQDIDADIAVGVATRFEIALGEVNKSFERESGKLNVRERIAGLLGDQAASDALWDDRIALAQRQRAALQQLLDQAKAEGNQGMVEQLTDQIETLDGDILDFAVSKIKAAIDAVERQRANSERVFGLRDRMASVMQAGGNALGAAQARMGVLQDRGSAILGERSGLYTQLANAQAQGNIGLVEELTAKIEDLDVQLAENTQAISDQTVAIRQVSIDMINARQQFQGGIGNALQGIITAVGAITGQVDTEAMRSQVSAMIALLGETGSGLRQQLLEAFGLDIGNASGLDLVNLISGLDFDALTSGMTEAQRGQFEALINAILENETAVLQNTATLNELNGIMTSPQGFNSSAWGYFREAIFNGMGGVLPQYQMPSGTSSRAGSANTLSTTVTASSNSNSETTIVNDIDINEAGGPIDVTRLTSEIAFGIKGAGI